MEPVFDLRQVVGVTKTKLIMRAAIINPYWDSLGGGERYCLGVACYLQSIGWTVDIQWKDNRLRQPLEERFGLDLNGINFIPDVKRGEGYDLCFWVSDGSLPLLRARRNWLHFQVPFHGVGGKSLLNRMKLYRVEKVICNSLFTKSFIDKEYGVESVVLYPPVETVRLRAKRKENSILFVGRFSPLLQAKNQEVLISAFKKLSLGLTDWKLVLAGGVEVGADEYLERLRAQCQGYPIELVTSPGFKTLVDLYGRARIFWSAVGYGKDESKEPEKVEHFGMTLVEAMAAKCLPIVYRAGGYKEIIQDKDNGLLWGNPRELVTLTRQVIEGKIRTKQLLDQSVRRANDFSATRFEEALGKLICPEK